MIELIRREFTVNAPLAAAWHHLAEVEHWPSWAKHINQVELTPKGELTLQSKGTFHPKNDIKSQFRTAAGCIRAAIRVNYDQGKEIAVPVANSSRGE